MVSWLQIASLMRLKVASNAPVSFPIGNRSKNRSFMNSSSARLSSTSRTCSNGSACAHLAFGSSSASDTGTILGLLLLLVLMAATNWMDLQEHHNEQSEREPEPEPPVEDPAPESEAKPKRVLTEAQRLAFLKMREKRTLNLERKRQEKEEAETKAEPKATMDDSYADIIAQRVIDKLQSYKLPAPKQDPEMPPPAPVLKRPVARKATAKVTVDDPAPKTPPPPKAVAHSFSWA